jgi:hypothetical protein
MKSLLFLRHSHLQEANSLIHAYHPIKGNLRPFYLPPPFRFRLVLIQALCALETLRIESKSRLHFFFIRGSQMRAEFVEALIITVEFEN